MKNKKGLKTNPTGPKNFEEEKLGHKVHQRKNKIFRNLSEEQKTLKYHKK